MKDHSSICSVFETAVTNHANSPAILMDAEVLSYRELGHRARQVAELLASIESANNRVTLLAGNGFNYVILYWGILLAGKISVELNPGLGDRELLNQLHRADSGIVLAEHVHAHRLWEKDSSLADLPVLLQSPVLASRDNQDMSSCLSGIVKGCDRKQTVITVPAPMADTLASIVYTSGTTGDVKGVCLSHNNLAWTIQAIARSLELTPDVSSECFAGHLPLYYTYGKSILHLATYLGSSIVFTQQVISPRSLMNMIKTQQITHLPLVPYLANFLLRLPEFVAERFPQLRVITVAGGALPKQPLIQLQERFPGCVIPMYGLTEATTRVSCMPRAELDRHSASCGKPLPGVEVDVVSDNGQSCCLGNVGEIRVRGPNVMSGYFGDLEATASVMQDEWLCTGDLGSLDSEGYLTISGRRKDVIKVMGESISASSIEAAIGRINGVSEVAVRSIPDTTRGEAICAYIVTEPDVVLNADNIRRYCAKALGAVRVPSYVRFVPDLPKTASGKIRKHLLTL